jgi:hypothetical protein
LSWLDSFLRAHPEKGSSVFQFQAEFELSSGGRANESDDDSDPGELVSVMLEFPAEKGQAVKRVRVEIGSNEKVKMLYKKAGALIDKRMGEFKLVFHAPGRLVELGDQTEKIGDVKCANCLLRVVHV